MGCERSSILLFDYILACVPGKKAFLEHTIKVYVAERILYQLHYFKVLHNSVPTVYSYTIYTR